MRRRGGVTSTFRTGVIGVLLTVMGVLAAQFYHQVPLLGAHRSYAGLFADTGGLVVGDEVQVAGIGVGEVESVTIDGDRVKISFSAEGVTLRDRTELAIKTKTALGTRYLEVRSDGDAPLGAADVIPLARTSTPYLLTDALGDLTETSAALEKQELTAALDTLSETLDKTAPNLGVALDGVGRFSASIGSRDELVRELLGNAESVTSVLSDRSAQINRMMLDGGALFAALSDRSRAVDELLTGIRAVTNQVGALVEENRRQLPPALAELNRVAALLDKHRGDLQASLKPLQQYATSLGESVASGPFFNAYVMNILPGQFLQPFIDAAFEEQGIDISKLGQTLYPLPCGNNTPPGTAPRGGGPASTGGGCPQGLPRTGGG